jgi:hypothetical protein
MSQTFRSVRKSWGGYVEHIGRATTAPHFALRFRSDIMFFHGLESLPVRLD